MSEQWRDLAAFPNYRVSDLGRIQNVKSDRILRTSITPQGHPKVKLLCDGVAHTRQVNHLVAHLFLPAPPREDFISPIHLNGDKTDCRASNMMWRPRYYAIRYHLQFDTSLWARTKIPVVEVKENIEYDTAQEAAMANGLVMTELLSAAHKQTFIWPTYQQFRLLSYIR